MENMEAAVQKTDGLHVEKQRSCLMPKFKKPQVFAERSFPKGFTQFAESVLQESEEEDIDEELESELGPNETDVEAEEKLMNGETHALSCSIQAMKVEPIVIAEREGDERSGSNMLGYLKDCKQSTQIESNEHTDLIEIVDTLTQNVQVDNRGCLDLVYNLRTRECDMTRPKRPKVFAIRDFPLDLKNFGALDQKRKGNGLDESGDAPVHHKSKDDHVKETKCADKNFKLDLGLQRELSSKGKYEKQEPAVTTEIEEAMESDVDLELNEVVADEETIGQFECVEQDNSSNVMVENVPLVKTAPKDAKNSQLVNGLCTAGVYPSGFLKRRKVSAVRHFPAAFEMSKTHNEASEKSLNL